MHRCYGTYQSRMNQLMHPCRRAAYTDRDGKWYCPACDPQGAHLYATEAEEPNNQVAEPFRSILNSFAAGKGGK